MQQTRHFGAPPVPVLPSSPAVFAAPATFLFPASLRPHLCVVDPLATESAIHLFSSLTQSPLSLNALLIACSWILYKVLPHYHLRLRST